jgi:glucosylceramidase
MKKIMINRIATLLLIIVVAVQCNCSKKATTNQPGPVNPPAPVNTGVDMWATKSDQTVLLQQQASLVSFGTPGNSTQTITVDSTRTFQTIDGFGFTLTGGSASLINALPAAAKDNLLNELFGSGTGGVGISYLRISLGASDLSASVFSYDDMPAGQTDVNLANFSLSKDTTDVIPILQKIIAINPNIKIMASPWSAPVWMKDNNNSMGGGLQMQYYTVYANYFVKYIQQMKAKGITVDAVTIQNEPQHGGNNPSMVMSAAEQANFVKSSLGPAFQTAGIKTKIIVWDHNCDNPNYPINVLNDAAAKQYIDGSAFHLYNGDISALTAVHNAHPDRNVYFTEQWTGANGTFHGDLLWHVKNVVIGSVNNWSKNALEWNLASDANYNPHTPGGCTECKGALTINGATITRNVGYYIIAHASKFVPAGSVRIATTTNGAMPNAAFITPSGKKVLIVLNDIASAQTFNIISGNKTVTSFLPSAAVATYIW